MDGNFSFCDLCDGRHDTGDCPDYHRLIKERRELPSQLVIEQLDDFHALTFNGETREALTTLKFDVYLTRLLDALQLQVLLGKIPLSAVVNALPPTETDESGRKFWNL